MDNLVGDRLPSPQEIAKLVKQLQDLAGHGEAWTIKLSPEQRRQLLKFRPGGERVVEQVARLARKYEVESEDTPVDGMLADLELVRRTAPVAEAAALLAERFSDTALEAQGECWHAATALYTLLKARARNNKELARELDDTTSFFAQGRRKPRTPTPAPTT